MSGIELIRDTREPAEEANDHPDSVFRPFVFATRKRDEPYADRKKIVLPCSRAKLDCGDYSIRGLETKVAIERKSGPDLLGTLFGETQTAEGERASNLDRFRRELERARGYWLFGIVVETSIAWLYAEQRARIERYGKAFDATSAQSILLSFGVDLACPVWWAGSKSSAEWMVGVTLSRIWDQASGGKAAKKAEARGYRLPWAGSLEASVGKRSDDG